MPPHQTDLTAETERKVSVPSAGLSAALKDAQAARQSNATVTAPGDVSPEKDAAGPPVTPTWPIIRLIGRCARALQGWRTRERIRASLDGLSERELTDIGIARGEIECIVAQQRLERLKDEARSMSRGVM
ncbi:hypothetical protein BRADO4517 [Bradyrhizobium sp. ORS 278]|uniref:DUF1127 domain-containing protein n=1 Tax=Bradyrhizobium sp. (strain ORS 278) TaxID=114615 RepID=UPI00015088A3|nr:DUF1127 domain-containing protein [Bradyrhizobium sp. ORS 278]CAL78255.1 hypothetical protein BRADO4517 [Bradyrhizobium sp. ORS 278]